jgi:hypothetical protein
MTPLRAGKVQPCRRSLYIVRMVVEIEPCSGVKNSEDVTSRSRMASSPSALIVADQAIGSLVKHNKSNPGVINALNERWSGNDQFRLSSNPTVVVLIFDGPDFRAWAWLLFLLALALVLVLSLRKGRMVLGAANGSAEMVRIWPLHDKNDHLFLSLEESLECLSQFCGYIQRGPADRMWYAENMVGQFGPVAVLAYDDVGAWGAVQVDLPHEDIHQADRNGGGVEHLLDGELRDDCEHLLVAFVPVCMGTKVLLAFIENQGAHPSPSLRLCQPVKKGAHQFTLPL